MLVRSQKILDSAKGQDCTLRLDGCTFNNEQTVYCHVGSAGGWAMKCGDNMGVYACYSCHTAIDGRFRKDFAGDILRAVEETQQILFDLGLLKTK